MSNQTVSQQLLRLENAKHDHSRQRGLQCGPTAFCTQWKKLRVIPSNLMNPCHKFCPGRRQGGCWHRARVWGCTLQGPEETAGCQALCEKLVNQQSVDALCRKVSPCLQGLTSPHSPPQAQVNRADMGAVGSCCEVVRVQGSTIPQTSQDSTARHTFNKPQVGCWEHRASDRQDPCQLVVHIPEKETQSWKTELPLVGLICRNQMP